MSTLKIVESSHNDVRHKMIDMLDQWLKSTTTAKWSDLVVALRNIREDNVAKTIESKLNAVEDKKTCRRYVRAYMDARTDCSHQPQYMCMCVYSAQK